jgi:hypothetical protein
MGLLVRGQLSKISLKTQVRIVCENVIGVLRLGFTDPFEKLSIYFQNYKVKLGKFLYISPSFLNLSRKFNIQAFR